MRQHFLPAFGKGAIVVLLLGWFLSIPSFVFSQCRPSSDNDFRQYRNQEDFRFRRLGTSEGLSHPEVTAILQDRLGFMWVGTADGLNRYDGYEFLVFKNDPGDSLSLSNNQVTALLEDAGGFLWVGTAHGLNCFDPETGSFMRFFADTLHEGKLRDDHIRCLYQDRPGTIWIGTNQGGLNRCDGEKGAFEYFLNNPADSASLGNNCVQAIEEDYRGNLWLGTMGGLCFFDRKKGTFRTWREDYENSAALSQDWVNAVAFDPEGFLWAGATHGLNRLDLATGLFKRYWPDRKPFWLGVNGHRITSFYIDRSDNLWIGAQWGGLYRYDYCNELFFRAMYDISSPHSLSDNVVTCILQDREGTLWVGTGAGLNLLVPRPGPFRRFIYNPGDTYSLNDMNVLSFLEESPDLLWIGVQNGGLLAASPPYGRFDSYPLDYQGWLPMIFALAPDSPGNPWIGTFGSGFAQMDQSKRKFRVWRFQPSNRNWIGTLLKDRQGEVWYGSLGGINLFCPETETCEYFPFAPEDSLSRMTSMVTALLEDSRGRLWVGTNKHGLKIFDRRVERYSNIFTGSSAIAFVFEDRKKRIWAGTLDAGLYLTNPERGAFRRFSVKNGLPSGALSGMAEDAKGFLWIATGNGLSRFDPENETFRNYDAEDGLPANSLSGIYRGPFTGQIFMATRGYGFGVFHPDSLADNTYVPPVVISTMQRFRRQGEEMVALEEKGISSKKEIRLSYLDHIVTFKLAALSFLKTSKNQYAYLLEGSHANRWIPLGTKREITFTNLDPGCYTLRVKGSNGDGIWNEEGVTLKIQVLPPWYASIWAYAAYLILGIAVVWGAYQFQLSRRLAAAEAQRLKELDAFKNRFFTNITHEFRTPLTVIGGIGEQIRENPGKWLEEGTEMIRRHSDNLLRLVDQMLALSKLEAGMLAVHQEQGDIVAYIRYLVESFHSNAAAKNIRLSVESQWENLIMDFDSDKIMMIVSNLLANAIKFTPEEGAVTVKLGPSGRTAAFSPEPAAIQLSVEDTGAGIPPESLPFIFDRFHQAGGTAGGSGIGLALVRELVHLLGGEIGVESSPGRGAIFTVTLLVSRKAAPGPANERMAPAPKQQSRPANPPDHAPASGPDKRPILQIAEDHVDVVRYLRACLEPTYQLLTAPTGPVALGQARTQVPDLIISDIMMPGLDGFELCRALKTDERTSHIPILLLTARADHHSRMQGLQYGADAYLTKPFHKEELLLQIQNLLDGRRKLQARYLALATLPAPAANGPDNEENAFVLKIRAIVEAHLDDSGFDVERLCREAGMSNSNLHRKLTALTGHSANRFIRHIRLSKACAMLRDPNHTIVAIAYDCGFNDAVYFSRMFRQEFGVTPSDWRNRNRE